MTDLGGLPLPAWERVDMARYAQVWRSRHGLWEVNVSTARGCPYRCNWCAKPTWGRTYHVRPVAEVVAELEALRTRYGPDRIWFTDDIFAIKPAWLEEFRAGYPGETYADVLATAAMVRALRPEEIGISVSYPLPGTVFHERMKGRLHGESWQSAMDNTLLFESDYPQSFYDAARELIRDEHAVLRFRPELSRSGARRAAGAAFHAARWPVHRAWGCRLRATRRALRVWLRWGRGGRCGRARR
jgi:radical SAM superfamily enzyme YgiQ (UPF0313 family)